MYKQYTQESCEARLNIITLINAPPWKLLLEHLNLRLSLVI